MKTNVKLFGLLREKYPDYQDSTGIVVELHDGAMVKDLLSALKISKSQGAVVTMNSRILNIDDKISDNAIVHILQTVHSG